MVNSYAPDAWMHTLMHTWRGSKISRPVLVQGRLKVGKKASRIVGEVVMPGHPQRH